MIKLTRLIIITLFLLPTFPAMADFDWGGVDDCAPQFVRVTYADPDTSTKMGINWNTKTECPTVVEFGTDTNYGTTVEGTHFQANGELKWIHEVLIEGLTPGTSYNYKAGDGATFSKDYTFQTAPAFDNQCPNFIFTVAGDSRADTDGPGASEKWDNIVTEALNDAQAAFVLNGGDLVKNGSDIGEWMGYLETTPELMALYPIMPSLGNHDDGPGQGDGANYNQIFQLPRNTVTNTEDYYYYRYGATLFVVLDTVNFTDFNAQSAWMDEVMAANSDAIWKFAVFHHPVYTSAGIDLFGLEVGHPPNEVGQNEAYVTMFDKYHFDFAIGSHNHYYERFEVSAGGYGDDANPVGSFEDGTVYLVSGGGGAITFQQAGADAICGFMASEGSVACSGKNHYIKFHIKGYTLAMQTWETSQQLAGIDPANHKLIDELIIKKPFTGDDPCSVPQDPDKDDDGYPQSVDCRDDLKEVNPGAEEICDDGIDNNCNELTDDEDPACFVVDDDDDTTDDDDATDDDDTTDDDDDTIDDDDTTDDDDDTIDDDDDTTDDDDVADDDDDDTTDDDDVADDDNDDTTDDDDVADDDDDDTTDDDDVTVDAGYDATDDDDTADESQRGDIIETEEGSGCNCRVK